VGLFRRKRHGDEPKNVAGGGADGAFEMVDAAGHRVRYAATDFEEIFTTTEAREMRRHVEVGWLLLDERVGHDPARTASWVDIGYRRMAGRVLPAQDDPHYVPASDVTTYVLGYLKPGTTGTRIG
jgi:hypothetical protein